MKTKFYRIIRRQLGLTALIATALFFLSGLDAALSAVVGGIVAIVPNYYFFVRLFPAATSPDAFVKIFYMNELIKLLLTVALFMLAFATLKTQFAPLFGTYILMLAAYWMGLFQLGKSSRAYG